MRHSKRSLPRIRLVLQGHNLTIENDLALREFVPYLLREFPGSSLCGWPFLLALGQLSS
jgi:hypothetical protein